MYSVIRTKEFEKWFNKQTPKEKGQINSRIARIREHGYFGVAKNLSKDLAELKWKNGRMEEEYISLSLMMKIGA